MKAMGYFSNNTKAMKRIHQARTKVKEADDELMAAMRDAFTPGVQATYVHGTHTIFCTVAKFGVGYGDDVHVRGESGKEYWVGGYRLQLL